MTHDRGGVLEHPRLWDIEVLSRMVYGDVLAGV